MAYSQTDIRIMAYSQGDICIHCIPKRAFAFIASLQGAFASWHAPMGHSHHGIPISGHSHSQHTHKGHSHHSILLKRHLHSLHTCRKHLHHGMHQWDTRIMAYSQAGICIMACTNGTFASWHTPKQTFAS